MATTDTCLHFTSSEVKASFPGTIGSVAIGYGAGLYREFHQEVLLPGMGVPDKYTSNENFSGVHHGFDITQLMKAKLINLVSSDHQLRF